MRAEQWWFLSGVFIARDTGDAEKNLMTEQYSQEIFKGGISFNLYLGVFLIKNNQYQKAFIFWV